jgi:PAS domain S-box-containing protein
MAPNGIYEIDTNGVIQFSNPAHHRLLGYEVGTLVGRSILDLVPEEEVDRLKQDLQFLCRERPKPQPYLNRSFTRDGIEIVVEVHWTYKTDAEGQVTGFIVILNDVTVRIEAESLREQARRAAEEAAQARSRFLAAASHDLRQPMQALSLFISRLERREMDTVAREIVGDIRESVGTLSSLLNSLLDMSKFDAGMTRATIEDVSLEGLFRSIQRDFGGMAERKGLRLRLRYPPPGMLVRSDARMLRRIIGNLVVNAITYTHRGGVLLGLRRRGAAVCIEVWDTGVGIDSDKLGEVFQEFYQVSSADRDRSEGLGLGLAIVDRSARALGHVVEVRSRSGRGSVFSITVPLAHAGGPLARGGGVLQPASLDTLTTDARPTLKAAVAVVEDDPAVRRALAALLEEWGCRVIATAGDGAGLLRGLSQSGKRPDIIIADLRLSGAMDGLETISAVRAEHGATLPALIVTGDTDPVRQRGAVRRGFPILHKPVVVDDLYATLVHLLTPKTVEQGKA